MPLCNSLLFPPGFHNRFFILTFSRILGEPMLCSLCQCDVAEELLCVADAVVAASGLQDQCQHLRFGKDWHTMQASLLAAVCLAPPFLLTLNQVIICHGPVQCAYAARGLRADVAGHSFLAWVG